MTRETKSADEIRMELFDSLSYKAKVDNAIMRMLKLSNIRHVIAHTSRGDLCLNLPFEGTWKDYRFFLDAVPLEDEENERFMNIVKDSLFVHKL